MNPEPVVSPADGRELASKAIARPQDTNSHARLAAIVLSSADANVGATLEGIVTDWNPAAERLFGYRAEEFVGRNLAMLVPPERMAEVEEILARARRGEAVENIETFRWTKDGRRIDVCLTVSPVRNDAGEIVATSVIGRDITARKRAAGAMAGTEAILRVAFEDAPIGMVLALSDSRVIRVNRALCSMLGYTADELLAMDFRTLTHPDDLAPNLAFVQRALAGEIETFAMEKRYFHRDGHVVWVDLHGSLVRDAEGAPCYLISQILDITERKVAETALAEAHHQTRQVLERITDGFFALDREWRFTYVNEAAERMLDQRRDALLGTNIWEAFAPALETPVYQTYQRAMTEGVTQSIEFYYEPLRAWFAAHAYPSPEGLSVFFQDVTATRQLIQETRDSEEKYRALVDHLPVVVYLLEGREGRHTRYFSPHLEALVGYSSEEALAWRAEHDWTEAVHPDDRAAVAAEIARAIAAGTPFRVEYRTICKDGAYIWLVDECVPVHDGSGQIVAWQGVLLDVTERVEAEAARAGLAAIVESAEDGILSCTLDGIILSWNSGAEKLYGYGASEAIGQSVAMLRPPELEDEIAGMVEGVRQGQHIARHETVRLTKDGRRVDVSVAMSPIRDATGSIVALASISRDVTALRQAKEAVRLRDRALAAVTNGILITDPALPDNPIVDVNPAFERLTGYSHLEAVGRNCRFLQGPETDPAAVARLREAIAAGRDVTETLLNYRRDGTPFWNDLRISAVRDQGGALTHFVGILTDVTARRQAECDLRTALAAAETANRTKTQFLSMMSHELRTPLQAVLGYAELLLAGPRESFSTEQREDLAFIHRGGTRMLTLINQMLDLSRIEAGRLELVREPVDLAEILEEVRQDVAPQAIQKGLKLRIDLPPTLPLVLGDAERLRQILLNLAGNAVKFTERGSISIHASADAGQVQITVRDTGIGIAPDALPHIFEEFRQVDSRLSRRHGGAGLGLAIAQKLAELMDARISVESDADAGSAFTLHVPIAPA